MPDNRRSVLRQIEQSLERIDSLSRSNLELMRAILRRYLQGEIGLDEAYYELLDNEIIPMPQRCGLSAKIHPSGEDEDRLKEMIRSKLSL